MIREKLNSILLGSKFSAIGITFQDNAKTYHVLEIIKKNDSLSINSSFDTINFEEVIAYIPKNKPVVLSFNGLGIITKKVENTPNYQAKLLFNANLKDFYWYQVVKENQVYASVVRKKIIDEETAAFEARQISVLDVSIGPFAAISLRPLLNGGETINTPNFELRFKEDDIIDFLKKDNNNVGEYYELGDEKIMINDILPFSTLVNHLYPNPQIETDQEYLVELRKEYGFKRGFNLVGAIALPTFLLLLLISYLMLGYYQGQYLKIEVQFKEESIAYNKLMLLENDKSNKESILKESGLNDGNFLSYYISEITKEIPTEINLTELNIFPSENKFKQGERVTFSNNLIELEGTAISNKAFTDWVRSLNKLSWLDSLEIVDFRKEGSFNSFKIKLIFNV